MCFFNCFIRHFSFSAGSILQTFIISMSETCHDWLVMLPLVHFLRNDCEPFGPIKIDEKNSKDSRFWGIPHELNRRNPPKDTKLKYVLSLCYRYLFKWSFNPFLMIGNLTMFAKKQSLELSSNTSHCFLAG